jgi:hypothetical protein
MKKWLKALAFGALTALVLWVNPIGWTCYQYRWGEPAPVAYRVVYIVAMVATVMVGVLRDGDEE